MQRWRSLLTVLSQGHVLAQRVSSWTSTDHDPTWTLLSSCHARQCSWLVARLTSSVEISNIFHRLSIHLSVQSTLYEVCIVSAFNVQEPQHMWNKSFFLGENSTNAANFVFAGSIAFCLRISLISAVARCCAVCPAPCGTKWTGLISSLAWLGRCWETCICQRCELRLLSNSVNIPKSPDSATKHLESKHTPPCQPSLRAFSFFPWRLCVPLFVPNGRGRDHIAQWLLSSHFHSPVDRTGTTNARSNCRLFWPVNALLRRVSDALVAVYYLHWGCRW